VGEDGIFGPDLAARTELPIEPGRVRGARRHAAARKPRPVVREAEERRRGRLQGDGFTYSARAVLHAQPILECFGYRLEADGASLPIRRRGPCRSDGRARTRCDVLVHMCHFISGTALNREFDKRNMGHLELAALGRDANVRNLVASHITEQMTSRA
jgi:hypothetical protein